MSLISTKTSLESTWEEVAEGVKARGPLRVQGHGTGSHSDACKYEWSALRSRTASRLPRRRLGLDPHEWKHRSAYRGLYSAVS